MYYVYIITNKLNTTFYIGMTNDLLRRIWEHRQGEIKGFSQKYKLKKLVYFEDTDDVGVAIGREKQLKNWHRGWKLNLIKQDNPNFEDLAQEWFDEGDPETSSG